MKQQLLAPLMDPEQIGVWFDDSTGDAVQSALSQQLAHAKATVHYWPEIQSDRIDLALIASRPDAISKCLREAATLRAKAAIVFTSDVSLEQQRQLQEEARRLRIAMIGPASFGIQRPQRQLNASICANSALPGRVALLSQSGALASSILDWAEEYKIGFSVVITLGNEADVDLAQSLDFLASDHDTHAIVMYLECVSNPRAFLSALRAAAGVKPVILLKAGATSIPFNHSGIDPLEEL